MPLETRKLTIRRQVLRALSEAYPATLTTDELLQGIPLVGQDDEGRELFRSVRQDLESWGYIVNERGDQVREAWWKITGAGREQINQDAPRLDQRIWGRVAVR